MTKDEARERRDEARKRREELDDEIAERVAEIEGLENGIEGRRDAKDEVDDPARRAELKAEIAERIERRKKLKAQIHELRPRREKAARAVKRWARRLRNLASPKVYDMAFDRSAIRPLYAMGSITLAIGHYTAGPLADDVEEAKDLWRRYDAYHKSLGWAAIGYNVGLDPEGGIALLRGPEWTGAHTLNYNSNHLGISAHGTTGDTLNLNQRRALRKVRKKWCRDRSCIGHRDAPGQSTACPGDMIDQYRSWGKSG